LRLVAPFADRHYYEGSQQAVASDYLSPLVPPGGRNGERNSRMNKNHTFVCFCVLWLALGGNVLAQSSKTKLSVDIKFPGGSGIVQQIDQARRMVRITPSRHKNRGWPCWWYLKISGVKPGETITLVVTEGFGEIAMAERTFQLFSAREGDEAAVNGATQIRAGVMRPEIVIPLGDKDLQQQTEGPHTAGLLELGTFVRIIRDPHFGQIGTVADLPAELQALESGSKARVLVVSFNSGERVTVPRANVELIEQ